MFRRLALLGCGLIGGSFALALRQAGAVQHIVGYSRSPGSTQAALDMGAVDEAASTALEAATGADLVLLAVPVAATESTLRAIRPVVAPGVLVMDVGSTKRDVVDAARRVLREQVAAFVPAHPIAGKELAGIEHADAALYHGRQVILTPLPQTLPEHVQRATDAWAAVGAQVLRMAPEQHAAAFAAVSHLPHLLAFAYFSGIVNQPGGLEFLALAGPGFRDFTRIAASSPDIWRDILASNREEVLHQARHFRAALDAFEQVLRSGDAEALYELIRAPAEGRAGWTMGAPRVPAMR